ncbi:MAG TPA: heparan-alpha-glucosaminide N-acetyltransferase domain-containing protein [Gemmatimonadaceae bacterium]|nr:heparan-alpha-glucosaminide N-acetyltransferase domain-containing protein [Gemmatimonadaceae bacterium]
MAPMITDPLAPDHVARTTPFGAPSRSTRRRVDSVDLLRGAVMILMALDHTRDYLGNAAASPTNLATASTALFLTRWITHFCAPVFFLLTGTGAALALRHRSRGELSRFLLTRGLWLIVFEETLMRTLWQFNVDYRLTILNVLWALGWSMIVLAALSRLPLGVVAAFGAGLILLHNLADRVTPAAFGALAPLWILLHQPGPLVATPRVFVFVAYPLIPWIGVAAVGFALGRVIDWPQSRRRAVLLRLGAALVAAFVLLRALNVYGDPQPWTPQPSGLRTVLSFLNTNKYPPSLLFLLMTIGPALLALRMLDFDERRSLPAVLRPVLVFGRVPLFYFMLHVLIIHLIALVRSAVSFGGVHLVFQSPTIDKFPISQPPGWPLGLLWVYASWVLVVVLAYPCCRWYAALRARRPGGWLSYL